jgi:hypothetical protein
LVDLPAGGSSGVTVPLGSTCEVTEPDNRGALTTTVAVDGMPGAGRFVVDGPTVVVVTNDFTRATPDDGGAGGGGHGGGLPATGATGLGLLALAAALVAGGALMMRGSAGAAARHGNPRGEHLG